jgi:hypothetical protein
VLWMRIPSGWRVDEPAHPWPWVVRRRVTAPDGTALLWSAWHHRRGLGLLDFATGHRLRAAPRDAVRRSLRIGASFAVGSSCFALGSFAPLADSYPHQVLWVFFLGSIFFTTAAYLQFHEASNAGEDVEGRARTRRPARWRSESIGWWATIVQFVGTIAFNISTLSAVLAKTRAEDVVLVWTPDVVGSICFLVSSWLALVEVDGPWWRLSRRSDAWWVAIVNLVGSLAFGVSAVAARVLPDGAQADAAAANGATFAGAVCFLVGAVLLPIAVVGRRGDVPRRAESTARG